MANVNEQSKQQLGPDHAIRLTMTFQGHEIEVLLNKDQRALFAPESPWLEKPSDESGDLRVASAVFHHPVKDVERYRLKKDDDWWALFGPDGRPTPPLSDKTALGKFFDALDIDLSSPPHGPKIAVLLESPHQNEYDTNFNPLGPARGPTGEAFHRYFTSHVLPVLLRAGLTLDDDTDGLHVLMINPVPYQASLRHLLTKHNEPLKNAVWTKLWEHCKPNFMDRLRQYAPKIILNGCTADLKAMVAAAVKGHEKQHGTVQHYNVAHPSQWQRALHPFGKAT
ncbi:hypothetical protein ACJ2CR_19050 [Myxococcus faecalis]|uniref:hypothetical protein n=1 Tax=Myxococcus faecalis TaxID=3115646 RepID=UPI0038CF4764